MTNASANTNAHHGAHATPDSSDNFLSSVRTLKEAEKSAAQKVEEAKKEAAKIEASAREKAVELQAKAAEKAVAAKNELLADGKRKTDSEIKGILDEAHKQAAKIRAKRLAEKDVLAISEHVI